MTLDVSLSSSFSPFLYPNQYIAYSAASAAVKKSFDLCAGASGDLAKIEAVYTYVTGHIKYDTDKAKTVTSGYLPMWTTRCAPIREFVRLRRPGHRHAAGAGHPDQAGHRDGDLRGI